MELLTVGDHQPQSPNPTPPHHISPFPPPGNLPVPEVPAQKLRPVRGTTSRLRQPKEEEGEEEEEEEEEEESAADMDPNGDPLEVDDEFCLSSSGDDAEEEEEEEVDRSATIKESTNRKRKRKRKSKLKDLLESLVLEMIEKQDQMHQQLLDVIERREKERIMREEAWKQQEMERMKKDEEARAEETSRNLALIAFIQNALGQSLQVEVAQPVTVIPPLENHWRTPSQNDVRSEPTKRRWPEAEVQALIMLRTAYEQECRVTGSKGTNIWDSISAGMHNMGFDRTARKCKEKWENMNKHFKKSLESGENSKTCPFFNEFEVLYKNGGVNPGNASSTTKIENGN